VTPRSRFPWPAAIALAALVPAFVALGMWQLHRATEKRLLQEEVDQRSGEAPLKLGAPLQAVDELRFRRIVARGKYDPDYQILLDNRVLRGMVGYYVVTPLKLAGGDTRVLVNRGWVALGESRATLPAIETPPGDQEIRGLATVPVEKTFTLGSVPASGWQPVWPMLDMQRYAAAVPFSVQPIVTLLDADVPGGFIREWPRLDAGIAVHRGYAFQWFALAGLAAVIFAVMVYRTARRAGPLARTRRKPAGRGRK